MQVYIQICRDMVEVEVTHASEEEIIFNFCCEAANALALEFDLFEKLEPKVWEAYLKKCEEERAEALIDKQLYDW